MKKKKKKKINKKKFLSRIALLVGILVFIIILITNTGKKQKQKYDISVIYNNKNITNELINAPYINKDKVLYLSIEDTRKIFDKNIYYEESTRKIITTYGTKVAAIDVVNNNIELNSAMLILDNGVLYYGNTYYIPISELTNVYNIEATTEEKSSLISSLYEEKIIVKTTKKVSLKEKPGGFGGKLKKIEPDEELIYLEDAEKKDWYKVLTYDGIEGYIKKKDVTEKESQRTKMEDIDFTTNTPDISNAVEINKEKLTPENLQNFSQRKMIVEQAISDIISQSKHTVILNLQEVVVETNKMERLVIELMARLKEIGASVAITNNNIISSEFLLENNI
ncbi:MAG: SH3 domain-containing protein [Clostridia bacterium]|nr:SH3 domain-containing protein [Clostridia bacterium]